MIELAPVQVVHDVGADDQVESPTHPRVVETIEPADTQSALPAITRDRILTRLDADVAHARSHAGEDRLPRAFARADVEDRSNLAPEHELRRAHRQPNLAQDGVRRVDPRARPPVKAVEVLPIVSLVTRFR